MRSTIRHRLPGSRLRACAYLLAAAFLPVLLFGCGIYVTAGALQPPFGLELNTLELTFEGANDESFFIGYVIWYRESEEEPYRVCQIRVGQDFDLLLPTVPDTPAAGTREFTVLFEDLSSTDSNFSFKQRADNFGEYFYFAVSSYGADDEESERVEFGGRWPLD